MTFSTTLSSESKASSNTFLKWLMLSHEILWWCSGGCYFPSGLMLVIDQLLPSQFAWHLLLQWWWSPVLNPSLAAGNLYWCSQRREITLKTWIVCIIKKQGVTFLHNQPSHWLQSNWYILLGPGKILQRRRGTFLRRCLGLHKTRMHMLPIGSQEGAPCLSFGIM